MKRDNVKRDNVKRDNVASIIGSIAGITVAQAIHKGFKKQGKVGIVSMFGHLMVELSVGLTSAGLVMCASERLYNLGGDILKRAAAKKSDSNEVELPSESGFVTYDQFASLSAREKDYNIKTLVYYMGNSRLLTKYGEVCELPELVHELELRATSDTDTLWYVDKNRYTETFTLFEIVVIDDCWWQDEEDEENGRKDERS